MIDKETTHMLAGLEVSINDAIDILIPKRDAAKPKDKYHYRYVTRKLEMALGEVHKALDKINA